MAEKSKRPWLNHRLLATVPVLTTVPARPSPDHPGAGAAGGIGMALLAVLHADFRPGIDLVIEQSGLDAAVQWADIVFTGEGSIDAQTMFGKTPVGVASVAKRHGKPVIAIAAASATASSVCTGAASMRSSVLRRVPRASMSCCATPVRTWPAPPNRSRG